MAYAAAARHARRAANPTGAHQKQRQHPRKLMARNAPATTAAALALPAARSMAHPTIPCATSSLPRPLAAVALAAAGRRARAPLAAAAASSSPSSSAAPPPKKAEPGKTTLAFVGIGIMGLAMATNLLKAGYDVVVWNRSPERCAPLVAAGARLAATPREAAASADVTFAMLADPPAALAVALGPDGVAAGMAPGKGYIDVSTVDADTSRAVAAAVRAAGGLFLEAPVSGSKGPAEAGALIFLAAGDEALFDACSPALDVMGKARLYLGDVGAGAHMKLVVNQIMGAMMVALAEGLSLAREAGLNENQVLEVASLGAINCPMFALKGPAMVERSYPTAFPLKHQQKDLRLALELAKELGLDEAKVGVASAAHAAYERAAASDPARGDQDFSAVLEAVLLRRP